MCRQIIPTKEKAAGLLDLDHYRWSIIDDDEVVYSRNNYLQELDELFVEAIKRLLEE